MKNELNCSIEEIFKLEPILYDVIGKKTLDELEKIHKKYGIDIKRLRYLREIKENALPLEFTEDELRTISKALGYKFEELFTI